MWNVCNNHGDNLHKEATQTMVVAYTTINQRYQARPYAEVDQKIVLVLHLVPAVLPPPLYQGVNKKISHRTCTIFWSTSAYDLA